MLSLLTYVKVKVNTQNNNSCSSVISLHWPFSSSNLSIMMLHHFYYYNSSLKHFYLTNGAPGYRL